MKTNPDWYTLLDRALAGRLAAGEQAAFAEALRKDPQAIREYIGQMRVHQLIGDCPECLRGVPARPSRIWLRVAAGLAILLLGGLAYAYYYSLSRTAAAAPAASVQPVPAAASDSVPVTNTASTAATIPAAAREETQGESTVKTNRPVREAIAAAALAAAVAPPLATSSAAAASAVLPAAPLSAAARQPSASGVSEASALDARPWTAALTGAAPLEARAGTELSSAPGPFNTTEIKGTIYSFK